MAADRQEEFRNKRGGRQMRSECEGGGGGTGHMVRRRTDEGL